MPPTTIVAGAPWTPAAAVGLSLRVKRQLGCVCYRFAVVIGFGLFAQLREYFLPVVLLRRAVEGSEYEHQHLGTHAYRQQSVAAGQVKNLEQCAPYYDSCTY